MAEIYTNRLQIESNGNTYILDAAAGGGSGGGAPINVPLGAVIGFMTDAAPLGFLECDGTVYNISQYPKLFQAIGNKFGGDGETTFAVPDLRGEFLRGAGENSHENQGNGGEVGEHQDGTIIPSMGYVSGKMYFSRKVVASDVSNNADYKYTDGKDYPAYASISDYSGGGGFPKATARPTNTSVLYCIKAIPVAGDIGIELTEEHLTGEAYMGKPVYEKIVSIEALPNKTIKSIPHNISNIDKVLALSGTGIRRADNNLFICLPHVSDKYIESQVAFNISQTNIDILSRMEDRSGFDGIIFIKYTKTTD